MKIWRTHGSNLCTDVWIDTILSIRSKLYGSLMSTPSKRKGSAWELAIVKHLISRGWKYAERRIAGSNIDKGDIYGIIGCVIEAKNEKKITLSDYLKELDVEMKNAKAKTGAVVIKKKGTTDVGAAYAVMPVDVWLDLLKEAGY
jgi:hypothetical protein